MGRSAGRGGRNADAGGELSFLSGGGELGERIRTHDWKKTPLGPPASWPQSLKTAVRIMLASRQPIWIGWGPELTYLYNDPYKSIIGGKHPDALGKPTRVVWGEIWDDIGPLLDTALEGGEGTYSEEQLLIMERHGYREETYYTFSYTSIPDDNGGVGGIICANTDDTQRIIAERQLALLREIAGSALHSVSAVDAGLKSASAIETNPWDLPFALIYLAQPDSSRARLLATSLIEPDHPSLAGEIELTADGVWPAESVLRTQEPALAELDQNVVWPAGPWRWPPTHAAVLPILPSGQKGRAGLLIAGLNPLRKFDAGYSNFLKLVAAQIGSSIARADAFEEEIRRASALAEIDRAKTIFFSNASHEFRTPLTLMLGPLQDMLKRAEDSEVVEADRAELELMQRNGTRLLKLVNTLLDFSRLEAGRVQAAFEPADLATYTAELASTFRSAMEKAGLRFRVDSKLLGEPVYIDRDMWEKIVLNLVSNAFKYTLQGEVAVSLHPSADGASVELIVSDTGVGIPADQLPRLFERFHRIEGQVGRTNEGTGIGLALVQELVRFHGGNVNAESEPGRGSRFIVSIPRGTAHLPADRIRAGVSGQTGVSANAYAAEALRWLPGRATGSELEDAFSPSRETATGPGQGPLILLADDNADMRDYIRRLLSGSYEVVDVGDGQAALAAARKRVPALVISDVMMPVLDGFGLLREWRADPALRDVPFILLSARAGEEASVGGLDAGADGYLTKPFNARELLAHVRANIALSELRRESVRVEAELRRAAENAQERAETILASINDGFMVLDRDWKFTYLNAAAQRLMGRSAQDLIGRDHWVEYPPVADSDLEANFRRAMRERVNVVFENYYAPWDRWFDLRVFPARDGGLSIFFQDVTARKRVEEELRNRNTELETVLDAVPAAVWIARDRACTTITSNPTGSALLHLPRGANVSKSAGDDAPQNFIVVHDDVELAPEDLPIQRAARGEDIRGFEEKIVFEDGSVRVIYGNASPLRDGEGQIRGAVGAFIDITELAEAREVMSRSREQLERTVIERTSELRDKEARLRSIFETSFTYQGLMSLDGTLLDANATALEGIGMSMDKVRGLPVWDTPWFAGTPGMTDMVRSVFPRVAAGETFRQEIRVNLPVGGWRWFDFQLRPVLDRNGVVIAIVPEAVETTARREAEDALRHAQKMEAIGQLTGGVAHDFNNLLTIIRSASDLLRRPNLTEERRWRYVDAISETADRAAKLTSQLLAFSRRQALSAHVFDAAERVESVADMLRTVLGSRIDLVLHIAERPLPVEADANQFETALVNLAANARDAMNGQGALTIKVAPVVRRESPLGGVSGKLIAVSVTDLGSGIPAEQLDKIFEPFFTTKAVGQGTGLGLSQVYGFVKQSKGDVVAESEIGKGTTFTLYLPHSAKPLDPIVTETAPPETVTAERGRVLVVEDNPEVGSFTTQLLDELGFDTTLAVNGHEALARLKEQPEGFDLVFSDVMMPGIDGIALGQEIRKRLPRMPFVLTSGYSQVLANEGKHGFELIQKPYTVESLAAVLRRAMRRG